ncbi:hypothetical protein [Corallococcus exercitus]|uniref:Vegetative protein n=1 Tax=Corallococcus exercitus TaxID=2316736 RepID=A0A7Y4JTZ9_9BACT|nr:hypothetical protein [Corallococcus exercitus]NOK10172.1 hypothetical protein [Corallococcus exercitus]
MARLRKELTTQPPLTPALTSWAEALGDAIGRGMLRALNTGMPGMGAVAASPGNGAVMAGRRRGRPPKTVAGGPVPMDRRCTVSGCTREQRSKGLCSAHYQAERRRQIATGKPA